MRLRTEGAHPSRAAQGAVIEAKLDVGRGPVATVLVQHGTLKQGDIFGGDLRIVWKAADDANAFLMSYGALKDLCALEEQVMQLPGYEETCRPQNGEDGRACEHPMSVTTALQRLVA